MRTLSTKLLIICTITLAISGCKLPWGAPPPPDHGVRASFSYKFKKFRALDLKSGKHYNIALSDASMEGAECMPIDDALEYEKWVDDYMAWSDVHCQ